MRKLAFCICENKGADQFPDRSKAVVLLWFSVACCGVRVSVMFHLMLVHYTFSLVWVTEWPPLGNSCPLGLPFVLIVFCLFEFFLKLFPIFVLSAELAFDCLSSCSLFSVTLKSGSAVAWWLMPRTLDPEVGGSSPTRVKPCCVLEQGAFTPQSTGNTQEAVAPSQHD